MSINKKGYSLVEMVVATGILSMIIVAFAGIMNSSYKVFYYSQNELGSLGQAATIMRDFEKTARGAGGAGANDTTFIDYTANKLTFYAYQRGDAYMAPSKVSYDFESDTLKKSVIPPAWDNDTNKYTYTDETNKKVTTFAGQISDHNIFSYYNDNSIQLIEPFESTAIRMVKIDVNVGGKVPARETTTVQLRNLKTNL